jgi:bacteriorhodopsin
MYSTDSGTYSSSETKQATDYGVNRNRQLTSQRMYRGYMEMPHSMVQAPVFKHNKQKRKSGRTHRVEDDDDKLPDDDLAHSLGGASYAPLSKEEAAAAAVDAHNYKICHANEGPEDLNVGESSLATASSEAYGKNYQGSRNQVKYTPRGLVTAAGCNCKCPAGTVDLRCLRRQMPGWTFQCVCAVLLILPCLFVWVSAFAQPNWRSESDQRKLTPEEEAQSLSSFDAEQAWFLRREVLLLMGVACVLMSLAYTIAIFGPGSIINCHTGRQIFWVRFVSWVIASPLMIWSLYALAGANFAKRVQVATQTVILELIAVMSSSARMSAVWLYFTLRLLVFALIMCNLMCLGFQMSSTNQSFLAKHEVAKLAPLVRLVSASLLISWGGSLLVWMFAEGSNWLCVDMSEFLYCLCDIAGFLVPMLATWWFSPKANKGGFRLIANVQTAPSLI